MTANNTVNGIYSFIGSLIGSNRHADFNRKRTSSQIPRGETFNQAGLSLISSIKNLSTRESNDGNTSVDSPSTGQYLNFMDSTVEFEDNNEEATQKSGRDFLMKSLGLGISTPPPISDSWRRIDRWADRNYHELWCQLSYPATIDDVLELENSIRYTIPQDVKESFYVHDGQDRGGMPTGIIFGMTLLDIEEVIEEHRIWKKVAGIYSSAINRSKATDRIAKRQKSCPPGAVQTIYAHPGWIPLAKDFEGNNIGVDLAPGPNGKWGQVIIFGRDEDVKYVIASSWSAFLANIADDFEGERWTIDDDTGALRLLYGENDSITTYIEVLKGRAR